MNKRALTILEILVSVIILSVVMVGITNLFISGKRLIIHSGSRMAGGEIGRLFLEPLNMAVRQGGTDGWSQSSNALTGGIKYCDSVGGHTQIPGCPIQSERTLSDIEYSAAYAITRDSPISKLNKVRVDVTWTELSTP